VTEKKIDKLHKDFSILFRHEVYPSCGDGWFDLVYETSQKIENVIKNSRDFDMDEDFLPYVVQIKEKFAGLRYYISNGNNEIFNIINEAEQKSYSICEDCGTKENVIGYKPLTEQSKWYFTLCENCREKQTKRMEDFKNVQ
jgi:RNA polymerase-binding transcription factor DksA